MKQFVSISDYHSIFLPLKLKTFTDELFLFHFRDKLSKLKTSLTSVKKYLFISFFKKIKHINTYFIIIDILTEKKISTA